MPRKPVADITTIFIFIALALCLSGCAKTSLTAGLPPVTTAGAMTFGPTVVRDSADATIVYYSDALHGGKITFLRASGSIVSATFSAVLTDGHISWGVTKR